MDCSKRTNYTTQQIKDATQAVLDIYRNPGVTTAIAYAFFYPDGIVGRDTPEYRQIATAYWQLQTAMIPEHLRDQNHGLCSGHKCRLCRDKARQQLQCDAPGLADSQAEEHLNTLIATAYAHSGRTGCSHDFCVIEACAIPQNKNTHPITTSPTDKKTGEQT